MRDALAAEGFDPESVEMREMRTTGDAELEGFTGSPTIRVAGADPVSYTHLTLPTTPYV